jgi:uncharacterized integral membrane protein
MLRFSGGGSAGERERTMGEVKNRPTTTLDGIRARLTPRVVIAIIIAVVAIILIAQNTHDTQLHLFFWHINRPMWLMLLILLAAGFIVGSIFPWFHRRQKSKAELPPPSAP